MKIEKNIPVPSSQMRFNFTARLRRAMEYGDSVILPNRNKAFNLYTWLKRHGHGSTLRKVQGGFRVWKLKKEKVV